MKQKTLRAAAALVAAVLFLPPAANAAPEVSARSAILVDALSGRVLFEKDADSKSLIASTTKIMTGLLTAEEGELDRTIQIPPEAVGIEGSSLYLQTGEELTLEELLFGMMLRSGNDAAVALAIAVSGSVEAFVARMNEKAQTLGLQSTHFANPNGLDDDGNYSTARDLAKLACSAMENETFRQVVSTKNYTFGSRSIANHNKLLWRYDGAVGIKTGFTKAAGRILVSAAERDGRRLVAVTINAPYDWSDHAAMLDYVFEAYRPAPLLEGGELLGAVPVVGGTTVVVQCQVGEDFSYPMLPEETAEIRLILPKFTFAPVEVGETAGAAQALVNGQVVGEAELIWAGSAAQQQPEKKGFLVRLFGG